MSEEELYLFDTMGFLRVRNVLDKATVAQALEHSMGGIASANYDDVSDWAGAENMINQTVEEFGDINVLICK